eukprot:m.152929 g.152929  ORF g.152929 m.152929 type:complete len:283 (-) comp17900_c0_seq1:403-1251(-)
MFSAVTHRVGALRSIVQHAKSFSTSSCRSPQQAMPSFLGERRTFLRAMLVNPVVVSQPSSQRTFVSMRNIALRQPTAPLAPPKSSFRAMLLRTYAPLRSAAADGTAVVDPGYSQTLRIFHWAMAAGVIGCFVTVQLAQNAKGKEKGRIMRIHKSIGVLLLGGIVGRVIAKVASKSPPMLAGNSKIEDLGGKVAHWILYGFMIFMPVSGVAMGYYGGKGIPFFAWDIPAAEQTDKAIAGMAYKRHKQFGEYFEYFVPLHVGASVMHAMRGQAIFARILPKFGK